MRHILIYVAAGAVCFALAASLYAGLRQAPAAGPIAESNSVATSTADSARTVQLAGQRVHVTVADTPAAREQGLSGRTGLAQDEGMLFVFPADGVYAFWMKDMLFSVDILWLNASGTVVYIAAGASPDTYPTAFRPNTAARYVLELPAGWAKEHNVQIGDQAGL